MGHLGFSYIGLLWLAMLFVPNLYWVKRQPTGYTAAGENRLLVALERIGEAGVTCCALVFSDFNLHSLSTRSLWLALSLALMMAYEFWWVRYFRSGRTLRDFYRLRIFLEAPWPVRRARLLDRGGPELLARFQGEWVPLEDRYFQACRVRDCCQLVLSGQ